MPLKINAQKTLRNAVEININGCLTALYMDQIPIQLQRTSVIHAGVGLSET